MPGAFFHIGPRFDRKYFSLTGTICLLRANIIRSVRLGFTIPAAICPRCMKKRLTHQKKIAWLTTGNVPTDTNDFYHNCSRSFVSGELRQTRQGSFLYFAANCSAATYLPRGAVQWESEIHKIRNSCLNIFTRSSYFNCPPNLRDPIVMFFPQKTCFLYQQASSSITRTKKPHPNNQKTASFRAKAEELP